MCNKSQLQAPITDPSGIKKEAALLQSLGDKLERLQSVAEEADCDAAVWAEPDAMTIHARIKIDCADALRLVATFQNAGMEATNMFADSSAGFTWEP